MRHSIGRKSCLFAYPQLLHLSQHNHGRGNWYPLHPDVLRDLFRDLYLNLRYSSREWSYFCEADDWLICPLFPLVHHLRPHNLPQTLMNSRQIHLHRPPLHILHHNQIYLKSFEITPSINFSWNPSSLSQWRSTRLSRIVFWDCFEAKRWIHWHNPPDYQRFQDRLLLLYLVLIFKDFAHFLHSQNYCARNQPIILNFDFQHPFLGMKVVPVIQNLILNSRLFCLWYQPFSDLLFLNVIESSNLI